MNDGKLMTAVFWAVFAVFQPTAVIGETVPSQPRGIPPEVATKFWASLASARDASVLGEWQKVALARIPLEDIRVATFEQVRPLLELAANLGMSSMEFFTDSIWRQNRHAILLSDPVLSSVERDYDLHSLFRIRTASLDRGTIRMQWLLLGDSQLMIGYDAPGTIFSADYPIATGKYGYYRFFHMNLGFDDKNRPAMLQIRGSNEPGKPLAWMPGPLGVSLKRLTLADGKILASYATKFLVPGNKSVPRLPIGRRNNLKSQGGLEQKEP